MWLVIVGALSLLGILALIGLLAVAKELFCDSSPDDRSKTLRLPVVGIRGLADRVVVQPPDQHQDQCTAEDREKKKAPSRVTQKNDDGVRSCGRMDRAYERE
jgi:hypothetical protein